MKPEAADIVETFRAAALGVADWSDALGTLAYAMGAPKAQLIGWGADESLAMNLSHGIDLELMDRFVAEGGGQAATNPRIGLGFGRPADRFGTDDILLDPALRDRWPIYRRLFDPFDAGSAAQTRLSAPPGITLGLSILRPRGDEAFGDRVLDLANAAAPGIATAIGAALTLGTHADRVAVTTAEALDGAVILLGVDRTIVSLSPAAEAVLRAGRVLSVQAGRLIAVGATNDRMLDALFVSASAGERRREAALRDADDGGLRVDLSPLGRSASGPLSLARVLVAIRRIDGTRLGPDDGSRLATRYGLTAAESEVALLLARGKTLRQIAAARGRSYDTVRSQVRAVFDKTGRHRQADLIALVRDSGS